MTSQPKAFGYFWFCGQFVQIGDRKMMIKQHPEGFWMARCIIDCHKYVAGGTTRAKAWTNLIVFISMRVEK
jgi:hypothetical protein